MYTRPLPDERGERWQGDHSGRTLRAQISAQARSTNALRMSARRSYRTVRRRLANNQARDRSTFHRWRPSRWLDPPHAGRSAG